jgi:hypothetical protein
MPKWIELKLKFGFMLCMLNGRPGAPVITLLGELDKFVPLSSERFSCVKVRWPISNRIAQLVHLSFSINISFYPSYVCVKSERACLVNAA